MRVAGCSWIKNSVSGRLKFSKIPKF